MVKKVLDQVNKITTDIPELEPRTTFDNQFLEFDFPGLQIGVAEYEAVPTGCTVYFFPNGADTAVDVRSGSPL